MNRRHLLALFGGTAALRPLAAWTQQKAMPVVGYLHFGSPASFQYQTAAFRQGLSEAGYAEGQNVKIEYRWAEGHDDRLAGLAADLAGRSVNVIAAVGPPSARAAKAATSTIPIVFMVGTDPVADRLVASLARPGNNLTGTAMLAFDLAPKRLELILELVPEPGMVALLVNPNNSYADHMIDDLQQAAAAKAVQISVLKASNGSEIDAVFTSLARPRAGALIVDPEPFLASRSGQIIALAARHAIPAIYGWRLYTEGGGLISYGPSLAAAVHQVGLYTGRILSGEKAADLPVQQPTTFELVINLKTAKALGLSVPPSILARADEVIE